MQKETEKTESSIEQQRLVYNSWHSAYNKMKSNADSFEWISKSEKAVKTEKAVKEKATKTQNTGKEGTCVCALSFAWMYQCRCVCMRVCAGMCVDIWVCRWVCTCTCICACAHAFGYLCVCVCRRSLDQVTWFGAFKENITRLQSIC